MHSVALTIPGFARVYLPCHAEDLLLVCHLHASKPITARYLGVANADDHEDQQQAWRLLMRTCPALFLNALQSYHQRYGCRPENVDQLIAFASTGLIKAVVRPDFLRADPLKKKEAAATAKIVLAWLKSRSNKAARNALVELVRTSIPPKQRQASDPQKIVSWVKQVFGKKIAAKHLAPKQGKAVKARKRFIKRFRDVESFTSELLQASLRLSERAVVLENDFERQLNGAKLSALKELAYGASHEINNPLANIATGAQVLIQSETDSDRKNRLARIYAQAMAAHEMISDLMLFAHPPAANFEPTDLRLMVHQIIQRRDPMGKRVRVTLAECVGTAEIDANQIAIVLEVLLRNAFEAVAMEQFGRDETKLADPVSVKINQRSGRIEFRVTDSGAGMDSKTMKHLFDPFYSGREAGRGLGFGLSKAWRIIELHGGEISGFHDKTVGLTTFSFWVPVRQSATEKIV